MKNLLLILLLFSGVAYGQTTIPGTAKPAGNQAYLNANTDTNSRQVYFNWGSSGKDRMVRYNELRRAMTGITETDPTVSTWVKSITSVQKTNWDAAYNKRLTTVTVTGDTSKIMTFTFGDGTTTNASWTDIRSTASGTSDGNNYPTSVTISGNTLTINRNGLTPITTTVQGVINKPIFEANATINTAGSADNYRGNKTTFAYTAAGVPWNGPLMSFGGFDAAGNYDAQFNLDYTTGNRFSFRVRNGDIGGGFGAFKEIYHDGIITKIKTDLNVNANTSANSIVQRSSLGYIYGDYLNTTATIEARSDLTRIYAGNNDGFIRSLDKASIRTFLEYTGTQINTSAAVAVNDISVAKVLRWKEFGNNHLIIDASDSTANNGRAISNSNAQVPWQAGYPNLMGDNGTNTFGLRVDAARVADVANLVDWNNVSNKPAVETLNTVVQRNGALSYPITLGTNGYFIGGPNGHRFNNAGNLQNNFIVYDTGNTYTRGNVGIKTTTPSYALDVTGIIRATGDIISNSDRRLKSNIRVMPMATPFLRQITPAYFNWKDSGKHDLGLIAQDIESAFPELVKKDAKGYLSVNYQKFTAPLLKGWQESDNRITKLESEIAELKKQIEMLLKK